MPEVRLSEDDVAALQRAADQEQRTFHEVLHAAVQEYTSGWRRRRDALLDEILSEDAALLKKVGAT